MMGISVKGLVKRYGDRTIVDHIAFDIAPGELVSLLGPSGCGKTTTLRCIAGLETPEAGSIAIDGQTVFDAAEGVAVEPYNRAIGMVFQSYAIWPHMTVFENVAFPLRVRRVKQQDIERRVMRALERVALGEFRDRSSQQLSGGQQQRVAVARAIVHEPPVLLFDEPLSNLDARLRDQARAELRQLRRELNVSTIYVTHDQAEALSLSDRVLVMRDGRICQYGTPQEIYGQPRDPFVAEVAGIVNFFTVTVQDDRTSATSPGGAVFQTDRAAPRPGPARAMIRPDRLGFGETSTVNALPGIVRQRQFMGGHYEYFVATDAGVARVLSAREVAEDAPVVLCFAPEDCLFLPDER
jgi:iron(III) transport system ATP-binding protein